MDGLLGTNFFGSLMLAGDVMRSLWVLLTGLALYGGLLSWRFSREVHVRRLLRFVAALRTAAPAWV